jgi:CRP-like cAMP-binding protein
LKDVHLQQLTTIADFQDVPAKAVVFREGQSCPSIFLVAAGNIALEINVPGREPRQLQTVGPGELLGWSSVLGTRLMTATARCLTSSRLVVFNAVQIQALCAHDPLFGVEFLRGTAEALASRLAATRLQLLDVYRNLDPEEGVHA